MKVGTRSVLFGIHQFLLHPFFVCVGWWCVYREVPRLHEIAAIVTHDLGYWGSPNMDGAEGQNHPARAAAWWQGRFGSFGDKVASEVLGHSRYYAEKNRMLPSRLCWPDKMGSALYPRWLYLLLGNLSGEIHEYMAYPDQDAFKSQWEWITRLQSKLSKIARDGAKQAACVDGEPQGILK